MGIHNVGSRVSIKDEKLNLNSVPSSARNKVYKRIKHNNGLTRDVFAEVPIWVHILLPIREGIKRNQNSSVFSTQQDKTCKNNKLVLVSLNNHSNCSNCKTIHQKSINSTYLFLNIINYSPKYSLLYILFRWVRRLTTPSTVKFSLMDADLLQIRLRGDFRNHHAEEIEVFTDGRQNDVDLSDISLTWHMKVIQDFNFLVSEYYNGDDDMDDGDLSLARQIRISFNDDNFSEFKLTYRTCDDSFLCFRKPITMTYQYDENLTKLSRENLLNSNRVGPTDTNSFTSDYA